MPVEIKMPQQTDTMTEGTLVKWSKKEGDKVKAGEEIGEIETDKATMPLESDAAGTVAHVAVKEGQKVPVLAVLAVVATGSENPAEVKKQYAAGAPVKAPAKEPAAVGAGAGAQGGAHGPPSGKPSAQTAPNVSTLAGACSGELHEPDEIEGHPAGAATAAAAERPSGDGNGHRRGGNGDERVRVSPLARRIAAENNVDLGSVQGSGPGGRIVQRDVVAAMRQGGAPRPAAAVEEPRRGAPAPAPRGQKTVTPMAKMRAAIAAALQKSKQQVPHFYETIDIDMEAVSTLRERLNEKLEKDKVRLSIADFVTRAVCAALRRHPVLNSRFDAAKGEVTTYGDVNLGIAVAVPDGLIVPVLRSADQLSLKEIRQRTADLVERARALRLRKEESTEGTFTITSLGSFGIREFAAIINPPEVGILAVGAAEKRAVVDAASGQIVARTMMTVTLSADHRVVDGATAAEFLRTLRETLEEPGMMLV
jgi:pyruvate dehydrogenase E2 component (dihydrolipoamide acetyltransferase)